MTQALAPVGFTLMAEGVERMQASFKSIVDQAKSLEASLTRHEKAAADARAREQKKATDNTLKEEKKRSSEIEKEEKKRSSTAEKEGRKREQAKDREFAKIARQAEKWMREEELATKRHNQKLEAEAKRSGAARERFASKLSSKVTSSIGRVTGVAAGLAAGITTLGGGFGVVDAVQRDVRDQGKAQEIALNSGGAVSKRDVLSTAQRLATTGGFETNEALAGIDQFIAKTGNADMALKTMKELGDLANATGADLKDLASAAGLAFNSDKTMSAESLMKIMRQLSAQGRAGALDMRDMASSLARVTATASQFGKKEDLFKNVNTLGGLAQLSMAAGTATSASEATESVASLSRDIASNEKDFNALGVKTKDKDNILLNPEEIINNALVKTGGDSTKLLKLFGARSFRAVEGSANEFRRGAADARAGGANEADARTAGLRKAQALLKGFTDQELTKAQVAKESAERKEEADKKLTMVFEKLRIAVGEKVAPELEKLFPAIEKLIPQIVSLLGSLVRLAEWIGQNPFQAAVAGLGAVISKAIITEIAAAALNKMLTQQFTTIMQGSLGAGATQVGLLAVAVTAAVASLAAFAQAVDAASDPKNGTDADDVITGAMNGVESDKARVQKVKDQGLGIGGDISRGAQGMFLTGMSAVGTLLDPIAGTHLKKSAGEGERMVATDQHIAEQLKQQTIEVRQNQRIMDLQLREQKEMNRLIKQIREVPIGPPPPPPSTSGKPPSTDGHH